MIVYISIGNSDDKLTQREWSDFVTDVSGHISYCLDPFGKVHGNWFSLPDAEWQNACWCIELVASHGDGGSTVAEQAERLKARLRNTAANYNQDSIAWAVAPTTEFLGAVDA